MNMKTRHIMALTLLVSASLATGAMAENTLDPATVKADQPIPAAEFAEALLANPEAWKDKEVSVVGYYKSSTYSSASDSTRIDLKSDRLGKKVLSGKMKGEVKMPASMSKEREGVILRGTAGIEYKQATLFDVTIVNRK
jgi:hypothetical protein